MLRRPCEAPCDTKNQPASGRATKFLVHLNAMNDDTDFDFDITPATSAGEATPVPSGNVHPEGVQPAAAALQPAEDSPHAVPTHHLHTPSGTVTVVAHDVMAALIAALAEVHRNDQG
jgi:hypothetical protein